MEGNTLGDRLRRARQAANLTQKEVAQKLGVTYQAVSNYERGKCRVEAGILRQLCILYHISPVDLWDTPVWEESHWARYRAAATDAEKRFLFESIGVPAELEAEYRRLSQACDEKTAAPEGSGLSREEAMLLDLFRRIPEAQHNLVVNMVEAALKSHEPV